MLLEVVATGGVLGVHWSVLRGHRLASGPPQTVWSGVSLVRAQIGRTA